MATSIKVSRPIRLSEEETLTTFEDWKNNLIFYLNQDKDFQPFLKSTTKWTLKNDVTAHRGQDSAETCQKLEQFLGVIASLAPPLLHGDIIADSTTISDIFKLLRTYYQFAPSESTFLKFASIKREVQNGTLERPLHLYLRMRQFIRDNLLLSTGKITHDGKIPTADETLSPTTERLIVLRWLQILHPALPNHVANVFAHELQTISLKDLQPRIAEQIDDLLFQIDNKESLDVSFSRVSSRHIENRGTNRNQFNDRSSNRYQFNDRNYNRNQFSDQRKVSFDSRNTGNFQRGAQRKPPPSIKKCQACRSAGEPFIGHNIYNCPNISSHDRDGMIKSFALEVDGESAPGSYEDLTDDVQGVFIDHGMCNENRSANVARVDIVESPKFNVRINNTTVTMVLDTGATGSMISLDLCKLANLDVLPSTHSAVLADGDSCLNVVGEVHTSLVMGDGLTLSLNAVVVSKLKAGLIVGMSFMKGHDVIIDISNIFLAIRGNKIYFSNQPGNPKTSLLRVDVNQVIFPGEVINVPVPSNFRADREIAVEPRENSDWINPEIIEIDDGFVTVPNLSENPVRLKRHQVIGQVRSVILPTENSEMNVTVAGTTCDDLDRTTQICINPDQILTIEEARSFEAINKKYSSVFNSLHGTYNGKSGDVQASVILGKNSPTPKKGKVPSYNSDKAKILQEKFDELVCQGVLSRPEENGVTVVHTSPSFLVKKADKSYRLVTSFVELNKYICPLPTKMSTTEDVITSLGKWEYIIKTDLKSAYFQIKMDPDSQKWLGTNSPFKGLYVYNRAPMGLKNMAEYLEEVVARVLGSCLAEGLITKISDDLIVGGNTVNELLSNWTNVLQKLNDNHVSLSAEKTVICPSSINVIGWLWKQGRLEVDPHRINPLTVCQRPVKVKQMRSFIGAVRAFSRCFPEYSKYLAELEDVVAGKDSSEKVEWNNDLITTFSGVQNMLRNPKVLTLPHPNDQLILISDGCNSPPAVGSTLYVKREGKLLPAGFFSGKLKKHQILWLPCEIEAVCISLSINAFSNFIRESKHQTKFLTDSKTCVEAFEKLSRGGFSLSPRISSFLLNLNSVNVSVHHIEGSNIQLTDFSSRNPIECPNKACQVCQFVAEHMEISVKQVTVEEIEKGEAKMPFCNMNSWLLAQKADKDLNRVFSQLTSGTRPGKKEKNLKVVRRYFQVASISDKGVLVHRKKNLYGNDFELIIVPQDLVRGLISALHIKLSHPTKGQLKSLWNRYFFAINSDSLIDDCTNSCALCNSLKSLPRELFEQSTSNLPNAIGKSFSADIIRRERQKILILMDIFSSFMVGQFVPNEQHDTLQQALIQLSANYKHTDGCIIRVDNAPGFVALKNDKLLESIGIKIDFGRVKNKNKNSPIDRAIQEVEGEIKRLVPNGGPISAGTLAIAICHMNDRIRGTGLSAKEVIMKRDSVTDEPLSFKDEQLQSFKYQKRLQNHPYSEMSKSRGTLPALKAVVSKGDIIHVKEDGSKHKARDFYLITDINYEKSEAEIQKFCGNQLQCKKYLIRLNEIYPAASTFTQPPNPEEEEGDVSLLKSSGEPANELQNEVLHESSSESSTQGSLRRSGRNRTSPDWLATKEIQRISSNTS